MKFDRQHQEEALVSV